MNIQTTKSGNNVTLALAGRLDTITQAELSGELEKVLTSEKVNLVFELSSLDYISSAGLRVLLSAQKKINALGTTMKLTGAKPEIKEIFEMTGFTGIR
jgi:anti-sigma B factor antagonist